MELDEYYIKAVFIANEYLDYIEPVYAAEFVH